MSKTKMINTIIIIFILILLITIISFSFAHFNTRITNNETQTTITTGSGIMEITYSSGENINAPNIFPDNNPFIIKEFTITGNNSNQNENMYYHLLLVLDENTFRSSALTYTLESINQDNNGYSVPEIISQTGIKTGQREIFLGNGMFTPTNNKDKVHSYTLKLYFPKIEHFEHGVDQGKTFSAHIETREGEIYPGYNEIKGVNHPVLFTGMTPVKWDGTTEVNTSEDDPDWYDYNEKKWANAKSADGSYWVWIPRYAYKIETCYHMSGEDCLALTGKQAGDIDVKFLKGTTNITEDNTPIESTGYESHVKDTSMHHFLHPAFQFNGEELGFWVAKFEPTAAEGVASGITSGTCSSEDDSTTKTVLIAPNKLSWRCLNSYNMYLISLNMKYKPVYGWSEAELDSHMMTNLEWGAVTYLSKSQYGANEEIWNNSYVGFITGCSGTSPNDTEQTECESYNSTNGLKASTTHNIYGVYDMAGGAWDRIMANYNDIPANSGFEIVNNILSKYMTRYVTENLYFDYGMQYDTYVYGDAIYETSFNASRNNGTEYNEPFLNSWYNNYAVLPHISEPWFVRGGFNSFKENIGIYTFSCSSPGSGGWHATFRPILTPLK